MGLISQFDHHVGRIVSHLEATGEIANTIIIVTSDHGDYLGDHWLGEKDLFHEEVVRIPLIVFDPRPGADAARGKVSSDLVEAIDLAPTFLDWAGGAPEPHRLEGRSLVPLMEGAPAAEWRQAAFCDSDFSLRHARRTLGLAVNEARGFMVREVGWKYVHFERFPPMLFDLDTDPAEQNDLGLSPAHEEVRERLRGRLLSWLISRRTRVTMSDALIEQITGGAKKRGYRFGEW
jgi:arylsulfatase A-like enzyme